MARYSMFVLKVPLNPNQPTNRHFNLLFDSVHVDLKGSKKEKNIHLNITINR